MSFHVNETASRISTSSDEVPLPQQRRQRTCYEHLAGILRNIKDWIPGHTPPGTEDLPTLSILVVNQPREAATSVPVPQPSFTAPPAMRAADDFRPDFGTHASPSRMLGTLAPAPPPVESEEEGIEEDLRKQKATGEKINIGNTKPKDKDVEATATTARIRYAPTLGYPTVADVPTAKRRRPAARPPTRRGIAAAGIPTIVVHAPPNELDPLGAASEQDGEMEMPSTPSLKPVTDSLSSISEEDIEM
ncbi:hypothetical protein BCV69DRAFT_279387 [Microstroma glucosiphilum]|uniref:Uncharacterized protein n=1 Tax=Pseudomicrostroma glucosiphilum TaxID=1684307 RepID=A0A316TY42_9BASI|nr:hypothetical protein BCV69DRAFT_279387 [Pseudomicrostroma glucosiphilum]PWN17664.1 hypothetical protein BCV69DRAFT_279387 [Pseudomicrostroma glucosiphilum]